MLGCRWLGVASNVNWCNTVSAVCVFFPVACVCVHAFARVSCICAQVAILRKA